MVTNYCRCKMLLHLVFQKIECFVDKHLTINQIMLPIEIRNMQINQHKKTCKKKINQFVDFNIQNHQ
jgi:hypothetical protein